MATATVPIDDSPDATAIDTVFEKLLADIISGVYAAGVRLPPERELSRQMATSRPTLREALRRLDEWNLVEPRRGSGIVVRPYRDWSIEVIAAYMRYGKPTEIQPSIGRIMIDMFAMRRELVVEVIRLVAGRVPKGGTRQARIAMARAWSLRDQPSYAREDFEVMRHIVEAAKFTPGLWLLNRVAEIWIDAAASLRFMILAPDDYVQSHTKFFDLIEAGEADAAVALMSAYLDRHDRKIVDALALMTEPKASA